MAIDLRTNYASSDPITSLFDKDSDPIGLHLKNIYKEGELLELSTTEDSSVVQLEGKRQVRRNIKIYNLDAILSVHTRGHSAHSGSGLSLSYFPTFSHS